MAGRSDAGAAAFLARCKRRVERGLRRRLRVRSPSARLEEAMAYACLGGGKRLRPALAYGGALAAGGTLAPADGAACAVELMHCYSLVHDDLPAMDDDDLRRGRPSVHRAFDEATAILAGDALQSLALESLCAPGPAEPARRLEMLAVLLRATGAAGMVAGQSLDCAESGRAVTAGQLALRHRLKTGALIRASVELGALSHPGLSAARRARLGEYGDSIGLAYQIRDDILDEKGDTGSLGRPAGSDRERGKTTYLSRLGADGARARVRELAGAALDALDGFPEGAGPLRDMARHIGD